MNYQVEISESGDYLRKLERTIKDLKARDRVRFIRLLKIGKATTQEQAGSLIGVRCGKRKDCGSSIGRKV